MYSRIFVSQQRKEIVSAGSLLAEHGDQDNSREEEHSCQNGNGRNERDHADAVGRLKIG